MPSDQDLLGTAAAHEQAGRPGEAEAIYRDVLARHPGNADLMQAIGSCAFRSGRLDEARQWTEEAVGLVPNHAVFLNNLGLILDALGELREAVACFEQAARIDPALVIVRYNLGNARVRLGEFDEAVALFRYVIERMPAHVESHLNLGMALSRKGDLAGAVEVYRAALRVLPDCSRLWNNLGTALQRRSDLAGAIAASREALRCEPNDALAMSNLGVCLSELGLADEALEWFRRSIAHDPTLSEAHSGVIFHMQLQPEIAADEIAVECRRWWLRHGAPLHRAGEWDRTPDRRLRVGYVSSDFRDHPVGRHLLPVLRVHDPSEFDFTCYSDALLPDAMTAEFRSCAVTWRESGAWSDEQLSARIREDRIDVLVDLALHSAGNRLRVFARQPAPVQASFAGYPGSTGVETIAYRLTDWFLDPPGAESPWSDEPIRLPDSFWCFDPLGESPDVNELPALASGVVVFGCLCKPSKVNERVIGWWSAILERVPRSRMLLLCPAGEGRDLIAAQFRQCGVEVDRVSFSDRLSRADYLALHHRVDVILDPFPYNGHMTTCDALWMGVPVVSLAGQTPVSRGGLSLLSNVGLPELAAFAPEDYVRIAADLANDLPRLAALRATLRERMRASPLMDGPRFARGIEDACRTMWREWCEAK
ncbi:MAG: tetratricopeptide repeat protein [Chthoniobacteraceae bacterium]